MVAANSSMCCLELGSDALSTGAPGLVLTTPACAHAALAPGCLCRGGIPAASGTCAHTPQAPRRPRDYHQAYGPVWHADQVRDCGSARCTAFSDSKRAALAGAAAAETCQRLCEPLLPHPHPASHPPPGRRCRRATWTCSESGCRLRVRCLSSCARFRWSILQRRRRSCCRSW